MQPLNREEVRRQVEAVVNGLQAAGVTMVPRGAPLKIARRSTQATPTGEPSAPIAAALTPGDARRQLEMIAEEVKGCTRCKELATTRTQTVFADGPPGAELCFLGEAPGADEDRQGVPFVGAAGQLLNKIIEASGFRREDVYICNILKCRPPGNRTPLPDEAANCADYLKRQLALVAPKYIVCLGAVAAKYLLNSPKSVGALRKQFHQASGATVMVTYHPAYLLRNPPAKKDVWDDMKMLLTKMGRPVPKREG